MRRPISRRRALGTLGTVGAAATLPLAGGLAQPATGKILLIDADLSVADQERVRPMVSGRNAEPIEQDLVWHWRRSLGERFRRGDRATALVRWDKMIVLTGLAREAGLKTRSSRIGRSLFRIEIG